MRCSASDAALALHQPAHADHHQRSRLVQPTGVGHDGGKAVGLATGEIAFPCPQLVGLRRAAAVCYSGPGGLGAGAHGGRPATRGGSAPFGVTSWLSPCEAGSAMASG
jgi:hypothetical protein